MRTTLSAHRVRLLSQSSLLAVFLVGLTSWAAAEPGSYTVKDLGALPGDSSSVAMGINQRGDVVGWSTGSAGTRAFVYTNAGGMVALPALPDRPRSIARDLNDVGAVVGMANAGGTDIGHAVLWSGGSVQDLGTLGTGFYSDAWGINNSGQVVGSSYTDGGNGLTGDHAFLFSQGSGMVDLTPDSDRSSAVDINDAGQVTGYKTAAGGVYHAFRWQAGTFVDLGVLPGFAFSFGTAINASGQVTGNSTSASGNSEQLFRSISGGGLQNLGGTGEHNTAFGINASGVVVGYKGQSASRALRFTDGAGLQDLNTLIDPSLGWLLQAANDINDAGQIAGYAFNNFTATTHAVRLDPTIAPPPECTFHCLRSTNIALSATTTIKKATVTAKITVKDETGRPKFNALVVATVTQPNGTTLTYNAWTNARGIANVVTTGPRPGTYKLDVVNIVVSLYTFNPSKSVLSGSIAVK